MIPHQFAIGSLCTATTCDGVSPILNESSDTATKSAAVALVIHKILEDRSAVVSDEGRAVPRFVRIAVVPIAHYISALRGLCLAIFRNSRGKCFIAQDAAIARVMGSAHCQFALLTA